MKSIVVAGSKGIGKAIADELHQISSEVIATSTSELDTADIEDVKSFVSIQGSTDILVLNTGGPPSKDFFDIQEDEWYKYYNQLFYSFVYILQNLKVNNDGYIFLISSHLIKEPTQSMSLSVSYRLALSSILKLLTKHFASKNISCINIAPGPIKTKRLESLVGNLSEFESKLPFRRAGSVEEISKFVRSIIENNIKYLSGVTINFDGGESNYIL